MPRLWGRSIAAISGAFGLCRYMLDSRENAEDATSEVFLKLQRSIESYDGSIPFPRWLLRVAGNQCIDALRRQRRGRQVIVEVEDGATVLEAASDEQSPLAAVMSKEDRAQVRDVIAGLPENYRLPLVLRYYSELSYDEIAQQLDLRRNYVAALIFRAKQELRRKLAHRSSGNADVSGTIGRDLTMAGGSLTLTNAARVGGNLSARVRHMKDVNIADGASIAGKRDIQVRVRRSQFERPRFYLHQAVWLAAAMLVGWLGLALFPGFFQGCTQAVGAGWRSLGLGVGVLAGAPVAIVVAAVTLVGIPVSLMLLAVYLAAIYLAKIWVGAFLGRMLLKPSGATRRDWLLGLLVGLLILTIVGFIPYLGGLVRLAMVCLGLGAFAWQLHRSLRTPIAA